MKPSKLCSSPTCPNEVPTHKLLCRACWDALPAELLQEVNSGQKPIGALFDWLEMHRP